MTASPTLPPSDSGRRGDEPFEIILEEDVIPRGTFDLRTMRSGSADPSSTDDNSSALVRQSWHQGVGSLLRFLAGAAAIVGMLLLAVHVYSKRAHQEAASDHVSAESADTFEPVPVTAADGGSTSTRRLDPLPRSGEEEVGSSSAERSGLVASLNSDLQSEDTGERDTADVELVWKVAGTEGLPVSIPAEEPLEDSPRLEVEPSPAESGVSASPTMAEAAPDAGAEPGVSASPEVAEMTTPEARVEPDVAASSAPADISLAARFVRALEMERTGDLEDARAEYARLLAEDFEHVGAHYRLGLLDQRAGETEAAAAHYRAAVEADPEHAPSWNNLSVIAWQSGDVATARSAVRRAIDAEPELVDAWSNRGWMALEMGERSAARRDLEHALTLDPKLPEGHYNLAILDLQEGKLDPAERHIDALTGVAPSAWEAATRELRGRLAEERGERPEALRHYSAALELAPGRASVLAALARLQVAEGRAELSWQHSAQLLEVAPKDPESHRARARVLMELEDWEGARTSWERALELEPRSIEDLYHLALASERAGVMPEALRRYDEVIELDEAHVPTLINLSRFYLQAERPEAALEYLERAEAVDPDNILVLINRGMAYHDLGRRGEAHTVLASAVDRQRASGGADPALVKLVEALNEEPAAGSKR